MKIGYACLTVGVPGAELKSCIQKNATPERLTALIAHNLNALEAMLAYNQRQGIPMLRISSDIIPFGSSPVNTLAWWDDFGPQLARIGETARAAGIRLSMHPGQYTVINSPDQDVVSRAVADLVYHCRFLDALGMDSSNKCVLHIGGIYGDKEAAIARFRQNYRTLPPAVKNRLIIENDDKLYTIADVLQIGKSEGIPVVFDNLHNQMNPSGCTRSERQWVEACTATWQQKDGVQKLHFSQQAAGKRPGSHADRVEVVHFLAFCGGLQGLDVDIMLEVKDKNLSAAACLNCLASPGHIKALEQEWGRYKYTVLERAPALYQQIRQLLKEKSAYPAVEFYTLLHRALETEPTPGTIENAALHVWGYFKKTAGDKEKAAFQRNLDAFLSGKAGIGRVKKQLHRLAEAYGQQYLLQSYYFVL